MTLHISLVTDRGYLPWCAAALLSCVDAHPAGGIHLHLVHDGSVGPADAERLVRMAGTTPLTIHPVDPARVAHLPGVARFGTVVWLRFLLPDLLPDADRVLYLDADTFVVADLTTLATLDLGSAPLGAVRNVMLPADEERLRSVGLDPAGGFLNSGVLLMDLARMRAEGFADEVAATAAALGDRLVWPDQDVLNVVCAGRWAALPPRYNAQNSFFEWRDRAASVLGLDELAEAIGDPAIVHFEGPHLSKPWHVLSHHAWRDRWRATLARTPWSDVSLEDDGPLTRAIGRLPQRAQLPVYRRVLLWRMGQRPSVRGLVRRLRRGQPSNVKSA